MPKTASGVDNVKVSKITTINGDVFYVRGNVQKAIMESDSSDSIIFFHGQSVYQDENDSTKYHISEGDVTSVALDQIAYAQVFKCKEACDDCACEYDECVNDIDEDDEIPVPEEA